MRIGKSTNPLVLKNNNGIVTVMPENGIKVSMNLFSGAVIGAAYNYNGIILKNEGKEPIEFVTKSPIVALSSQEDIISVYEANESEPWLLRTNGIIINPKEEIEELYSIPTNGEIRKKSSEDLEIVIEANIIKSSIKYKGETLPLNGGLVLGDDIYGFKITVNIEGNESVIVYPTHAPIYGVELNGTEVKVFERDKSIPWTFTQTGFLLNEADYNKILRSEQAAYCARYGLTQEELKRELGFDPSYPERKLS